MNVNVNCIRREFVLIVIQFLKIIRDYNSTLYLTIIQSF